MGAYTISEVQRAAEANRAADFNLKNAYRRESHALSNPDRSIRQTSRTPPHGGLSRRM